MVLPNRPSGLPEKERTCYAGYSVVKVLGNGLYTFLPKQLLGLIQLRQMVDWFDLRFD